MALKDLMDLTISKDARKQGLSDERLAAIIPVARQYIAFWREYPDLFVDFLCGGDQAKQNTLHLFFYQRVFLRAAMRHRVLYAVFPRAFSKSFLSVLILMLRCVLFPNAKLFVTTGGKEQAANITREKVDELCLLIPGLKKEINWSRGQSKSSKDSVEYIFKNGSVLNIVAAKNSSRGGRRTGGLVEEAILVDGTMLNEVILPLMNVDRLLPNGTRYEPEVINKSQIFVTTAGWKNSFAYEKLIEILVKQVITPDEYMILGGTYKIPIMEGLLSKNFVTDLKLAGTYNDQSFSREYESFWSGDAENAFFSSDVIDKYRVLQQPEYEYSGRSTKQAYYVVGVDVGRFSCTTEACIFKVTPQPQGAAIKSLVNIYSFDAEHFEAQAIYIKKLFYRYKARVVAIDANGVGAGLVDFMTKSQVDPETNDVLPPFGVENDEDGRYRKLRTPDTEPDAMFLIKANAAINTELYSYAQVQMMGGKIKFLIDENTAKVKLMAKRVGQEMDSDKRADYLKPFTLTSILREELLNLVQENEGINIILKQSSRSVKKDKFSAFIYGLYWIKKEEERRARHKNTDFKQYMFFTQS